MIPSISYKNASEAVLNAIQHRKLNTERRFILQVKNDKINYKNLDNRIMSFDEMPLFLNVNDVSKILRIGRNSTYELFNSTGFPRIRIAGQFRINKYELMRWLKTSM